MESKITYFDNNATTQVDESVLAKMIPYFREKYGNASSTYDFGKQVHQDLEQARFYVAKLVGAQSSQEILFTSCGSESDNTAIRIGTAALPERKCIVTSHIEHLAILETVRDYARFGYDVIEIGVDSSGRLDMDAYREAVDENTCLVSLMWANNETGVIFPVEECAEYAKSKGALFHTDAVQAAGKVPIDLTACECIDMLSLSGHKFHAPKGIGALYVRASTPFVKFMQGGHQERNRRAGTEASALIVGLGEAARIAKDALDDENVRVRALRDRMETELESRISDMIVNGKDAPRTPNTLSLAFRLGDENVILKRLNEGGICASSGSACNSKTIEPSYVMVAMGLPSQYLNSVIRLSLSRKNTDEDVDRLISVLPKAVKESRVSSIWIGD